MLLTEAQLHEVRAIVADHHNAFIVNTIGTDTVAPAVLQGLKDKGLVNVKVSSIEDAYLYGQLLAMMDSPAYATMTYEQFKKHVQKNPIPLNQIELQAVQFAKHQAAQHVRGLGNKVDVATGTILIEADAHQRAMLRDVIKDKTSENIAKREAVKKLKSELGWATGDWARDWDRIAITEKQNAMQRGVADHYAKRYGGDVYVAKRPMPDACKHCFTAGTQVITRQGALPIEKVMIGDEVLTHKMRWRPVTEVFRRDYSGEIFGFGGGEPRATGNHPYLASGNWVRADSIQTTDHVLVLRAVSDTDNDPVTSSEDSFFPGISVSRFGSVMPISPIQLYRHLQVRDSDVDVVNIDSFFQHGGESSQAFAQTLCVNGCQVSTFFSGLGCFLFGLFASRFTESFTRFCSVSIPRFWDWLRFWIFSFFSEASSLLRSSKITQGDIVLFERGSDGSFAFSVAGSQLLDGQKSVQVQDSRFGGVDRVGIDDQCLLERPDCDPVLNQCLFYHPDGYFKLPVECPNPSSVSVQFAESFLISLGDVQHTLEYREVGSISKGLHSGIVYNLGVAEDESYVAEGTVVHNCNRLHLGPDGQPRIFKLVELEANGTNVGRKANDWLPVVGTVHPNCWTGDTLVTTFRGEVPIEDVRVGDLVLGADSRFSAVTSLIRSEFDGELSVIRGDGWKLRPTPNHPIRVGDDWIDASNLQEGSHLVQKTGGEDLSFVRTYSDQQPPVPQKVRCFLRVFHGMLSSGVPVTAIDFDGDLFVREGYVHVVDVNGELRDASVPKRFEGGVDGALSRGNGFSFSTLCAFGQVFHRAGRSPASLVSGSSILFTLLGGEFCVTDELGVSFRARPIPSISKSTDHYGSTDLELLRYRINREQIIEVEFFNEPWGNVNPPGVLGKRHSVLHSSAALSLREFGHSDGEPLIGSSGEPEGFKTATNGSRASLKDFGHFTREFSLVKHEDQGVFVDVDCHCSSIIGSQTEKYKGTVYNLSVANSESYFANGILVHNCQCQMVRVPDGWGFDAKGSLVPGGEYGERYDTEDELQLSMLQEMDLQKAFKLQGRTKFQGLPIAIENKVGSVRTWKDDQGGEGSTTMLHAYGYIERTTGADEDEVDVFLGPDPNAKQAYIVNQRNVHTDMYDETKVMLGFSNAQLAKEAYEANYNCPDFAMWMETMTVEQFKRWVGLSSVKSGEMMKSRVPHSSESPMDGAGRNVVFGGKVLDRCAFLVKGKRFISWPEASRKAIAFFAASGKTPTLENLVDTRLVSPQESADLSKSLPFVPEFEGITQGPVAGSTVKPAMLGLGHQLQIGGTIIKAIPVAVMDDFFGAEKATKDALHNDPVLKSLASIHPDKPVLCVPSEFADVPALRFSSHEGERNSTVIKSQTGGLKFVVPLQKSGKLDSTIAAEGSPSAASVGSPSPGTSANYVMNVPARKPAEPVEGIKEILDEMSLNTDDAVKRDKETYHFQEPIRNVHPMVIPENFHGEDEVGTGKTEERRKNVDRFLVQNVGVTKNTVNVEDQNKEEPPLKKSSVGVTPPGGTTQGGYKKIPDGKGGFHYVKPEKKSGQSVQSFALSHGGKVTAHRDDPDVTVIKVLKANTPKLEKFRGQHGIEAKVFTGGKYARLSITKEEMTKLKEYAPKTKAPSKELEVPAVEPTIPVDGSTVKRLGDVQTLEESDLEPPPVHPGVLQRGHLVSVNIGDESIQTELTGYDSEGKPTVMHKGNRVSVASFKELQSETHEYKPAYHGLPEGALVKPSADQRKLVKEVMTMQVVGKHQAKEYINWLHTHGQEVFLVGGIVRDMVAGTVPESKMSHGEVLETMKDVDIVSTAHPRMAHQMMSNVSPDVVGNGVTNDHYNWGVVRSIGLGVGLDYSSMNAEGAWTADPTWDHGMEEDVQRRDFTCNSLFYDVHNDVIIDPTGTGLADAQNTVLRLAPSPEEARKNKGLPVRFWKFRMRGYAPEKETLAFIKKHADTTWTNLKSKPYRIVKDVYKAIGKSGDPEKNLAEMKEVMIADGAGDLYEKHLKPLESQIIAYAKKKGPE